MHQEMMEVSASVASIKFCMHHIKKAFRQNATTRATAFKNLSFSFLCSQHSDLKMVCLINWPLLQQFSLIVWLKYNFGRMNSFEIGSPILIAWLAALNVRKNVFCNIVECVLNSISNSQTIVNLRSLLIATAKELKID